MFIKSSQNDIFVVQKCKLHILEIEQNWKQKQDWEHAFHSRNPKVTLNRKEYWQQHDGYKADNLDLTNNPALSLLLELW